MTYVVSIVCSHEKNWGATTTIVMFSREPDETQWTALLGQTLSVPADLADEDWPSREGDKREAADAWLMEQMVRPGPKRTLHWLMCDVCGLGKGRRSAYTRVSEESARPYLDALAIDNKVVELELRGLLKHVGSPR